MANKELQEELAGGGNDEDLHGGVARRLGHVASGAAVIPIARTSTETSFVRARDGDSLYAV